jgi:hypothetical protein
MAGQTHVITVDPDTRKVELVEQSSIASGSSTPIDNTITNAKMADVPTATLKGRNTAGTGDPEDLTPAQVRTILNVADGATANAADASLRDRSTHTGTQPASTISDLVEVAQDLMSSSIVAGTNVTLSYNDTSGQLTINAAAGVPGADSVSNTILSNMAQATFKGRAAGAGTGDPTDLTAAEARAILNVADGATANSPDATLLSRASHTGTQDASTTLTGLSEIIDDRVSSLAVAGTGMTITYDDVANTLTFDASSALSGNFLASGTGAVTRTMQNRVRDTGVYVTDYFNSGTDGTNYSPALTRALAVSRTVIWPAGTYTMSTRVAYPENAVIIGERSFSDGDGGTKITCNAGFVYNSSTTRKRIQITGFDLNGNKTAGIPAIGGPFGGVVERCKIDDFDIGIQNASSFLSDYDLIAFGGTSGGSIALDLADANGVSVTRCYFAAQWTKHISTVDVTPLTGSDNGMALYLFRNNHNASGNVNTGNSLITISGNIVMLSNYFEAYPAATNWAGKFVDVKVNGFGDFGFTAIGNEMNGGGADGALNGFYFNGTRTGSLPNNCGGIIMGNRLLGFDASRPAIAFGANNCVTNLRICDNSPTPTISNKHARSIYKPFCKSTWSGTTAITGSVYVDLPIGNTKTDDIADGFGASTVTYTTRKAGRYAITCNATVQSTAASFANIEVRLVKNGTQVAIASDSLTFVASPTKRTINISTIENLALNDTIQVEARANSASACTAPEGVFTIEFIGDGNF